VIVVTDRTNDLGLTGLYPATLRNARKHASDQLVEPRHDITIDVGLGVRISDAAVVGRKM
jgi:hypothetical protein